MTTATDALKLAWDFYNVPNLPVSKVKEPDKAEIRAGFDLLGGEIAAAVTSDNPKPPVASAILTNVNLVAIANGTVMNGYTLQTGDSYAALNQTDKTQIGVYSVPASSGTATRRTDMNAGDEIRNASFSVTNGTLATRLYKNTNDTDITVGVTEITFTELQNYGPYLTAVVQPIADDAAASAASAAADAASVASSYSGTVTQVLGRPGDMVVGTAFTSSHAIFGDASDDASNVVSEVRFTPKASGNIFVETWTLSSGTLTRDTVSSAVAVVSGGEVVLTSADFGSIPVGLGKFVGLAGSGVGSLLTALSDGAGTYFITGTSGTATLVNTSQIQARVTLSRTDQIVTGDGVASVTADVAEQGAVVDLLSSTGIQLLGRTGTPITGSAAGGGTAIFMEPVEHDGSVIELDMYAMNTGNFSVSVWEMVPNSVNIQRIKPPSAIVIAATGLQTLTSAMLGGLTADKGQYIGVSGATILATTANPANSNGWTYVSGAGPTPVVQPAISTRVEVAVRLSWTEQYSRDSNVKPLYDAAERNYLDLNTVERTAMMGNSYWEGYRCVRGKTPIQTLSGLTNRNWCNLSQAGATPAAILAILNNRTLKFGGNFHDYRVTTCLYGDWTNYFNGGGTEAGYLPAMQAVHDKLLQLGAKPLPMTEWGGNSLLQPFAGNDQRSAQALRLFADKNGVPLINQVGKTRVLNRNPYTDFWFSNIHPGTRTSYMQAAVVKQELKQLPMPKSWLKVFTARTTITISSVADLLFNTIAERFKVFREIYIGQTYLDSASQNYYDNSSGYATNISGQYDDYFVLQRGTALSLTEYILIDAGLPDQNIKGLRVENIDSSATVYALDRSANTWVALTYSDDAWQLTDSLAAYGEVSLLVYKSGGVVQVGSPRFLWDTGVEKVPQVLPYRRPTGALLTGQPLLVVSGAVPAAWNNPSTLPVVVPADSVLPYGTTGCVVVTLSASVNQTFTYTADNEDREVVISVWSRYFPAIHNPAVSFASGPITEDTADIGILKVSVVGTDGKSLGVESMETGLHWFEQTFRTTAQALSTEINVAIGSLYNDVQVSRVEMRFAS